MPWRSVLATALLSPSNLKFYTGFTFNTLQIEPKLIQHSEPESGLQTALSSSKNPYRFGKALDSRLQLL